MGTFVSGFPDVNPYYPIMAGQVGTTWSHYAIVYDSGAIRCYRHGKRSDMEGYTSAPIPLVYSDQLMLGDLSGSSCEFYVAEFRLSAGVARYNENFTPMSVPYS